MLAVADHRPVLVAERRLLLELVVTAAAATLALGLIMLRRVLLTEEAEAVDLKTEQQGQEALVEL
jgi:hypothetical protein